MLLGASSKLRCCGFFSSLSTHSLFREHTEKQVTLAYKAGCLLPLGRFYCAHWLTLRMFLAHTLGFCYSTNRTLISSCAVLLVRWLFSFRFSLRLLLPKKKWIKKPHKCITIALTDTLDDRRRRDLGRFSEKADDETTTTYADYWSW